jgi:hypothetical protein
MSLGNIKRKIVWDGWWKKKEWKKESSFTYLNANVCQTKFFSLTFKRDERHGRRKYTQRIGKCSKY